LTLKAYFESGVPTLVSSAYIPALSKWVSLCHPAPPPVHQGLLLPLALLASGGGGGRGVGRVGDGGGGSGGVEVGGGGCRFAGD